MNKSKKLGLVFFLCAVVLVSSLSCGSLDTPASEKKIKMTGTYFDTVVEIELWDSNDESILDQCKKICDKYEKTLSRTIETSEISRINAAGGKPVQVSDETAMLIREGLSYSRISDGLFDITIAPLSILWDVKNNPGIIPNMEEIEEAKSHVGYQNVTLNGNIVTLKDPKAGIDLGAVAKGFVADKLKEYLISKGVGHAIINLGGNVLTVGKKPNGKKFRIGIQKPFAPRNETLTVIEVDGKSVVSSGIYERYFEKDGKYYHHILNPMTGFPFENNLLQVSIISDSSLEGDCLSTTCFVLGLEKGTKLIDSLKNVQAIFVTDDYEMHGAGGMEIP